MEKTEYLANGEALASTLVVLAQVKAATTGKPVDYLEGVGMLLTAAGTLIEKSHPGNARAAAKLYAKSLRRHAAAVEKAVT